MLLPVPKHCGQSCVLRCAAAGAFRDRGKVFSWAGEMT